MLDPNSKVNNHATLALNRARVYYFFMKDRKVPDKLQKTVFIFGISSFVGSNLAGFLKRSFRVIGSYNDHPVEIEDVLTLPLDVLNREAIQLAFFIFRPDIVIYCAGLSSLMACAENEKLADTLNTTGLFNVANFTERYRSKLIYISTSYVFSGEKVTYLEDDTPLTNTIYGKSKGATEFFIQKNCLNYLILRCCDFYGRSLLPGRPTWFEVLQKRLFEGKNVGIDGNVQTGFLDIIYLAMIIKTCIEQDITKRLFQVCSTDIMSRYEFALEYVKVFSDKEGLISKKSWDFPQIKSLGVQSDISEGLEYQMDVENVESFLKIKMPSIRESLDFTKYYLGTNSEERFSQKKSNEVTFI